MQCSATCCSVACQSVFALQVHAGEELTTVIDGEALVDDGVAAVLYAIFLVGIFILLLPMMPCYSKCNATACCAPSGPTAH